jgi:hypothetical protein
MREKLREPRNDTSTSGYAAHADLIDHHKEAKGRHARTRMAYEGKGRGPCVSCSALPLGKMNAAWRQSNVP